MAPRATPKTRRNRIDAIPVTRGSGNVFADLGFPNPEEHLAKAQLVSFIDDVIRERKLTQRQAAKLMGIDQPKVSHILSGRFAGFSMHRLMDFLTSLGCDVDIRVKPSPKSRKLGRLRVAPELMRVPSSRHETVESGAELLPEENESFAAVDARMAARGSVAAREGLATARGKGGQRSRAKSKRPSAAR
jgi:predicted XRE-type DNA-binding protein